jgi:hypothetical protein
MARIICKADCSNSPKKEILKKINEAFAAGDPSMIDEYVAENVALTIIGDSTWKGKQELKEMIPQMSGSETDEWEIFSIITHGKEGAVNGMIKTAEAVYEFCDVYEFVSAGKNIVKSIKSFVIKTN